MLYSVIIAGGEGTRLWPLSTSNAPKPLLKVFKDKTLLELTIERLLPVTSKENILIIITKNMESKVKELLPLFPQENIIVEPIGKNTAPCIALAARILIDKDQNAEIGIFPSDHIIINQNHFYDCVRLGKMLADKYDRLVLLGMPPVSPSTGYGYILLGDEIADENHEIKCFWGGGFQEKPPLNVAKKYLKKGNTLWNSGIYIGKASQFLKEIERNLPNVYDSINLFYKDHFGLRNAYESFPSVSIDYAITEKLTNFIAIWSNIERIDVGNFNAFFDIWEKDELNNAVDGEFIGINSSNNIIFSPQKSIAAIGINNMVIINTSEVTMICPRENISEIKALQKRWNILK